MTKKMNNLESRYGRGPARVIPGFRLTDLVELFAALGYRTGAEIGVAQGRFSEQLCRAMPGLELLCVDPWCGYQGDTRNRPLAQHVASYDEARRRLAPFTVTIRRAMSMDAVESVPLESLDFVFVDANHSYQHVREDLLLWSARVRPGGIVAGDDYYVFKYAGVIEAVHDVTRTLGITTWWITDDPTRKNYRGQQQPAYFWVKP